MIERITTIINDPPRQPGDIVYVPEIDAYLAHTLGDMPETLRSMLAHTTGNTVALELLGAMDHPLEADGEQQE